MKKITILFLVALIAFFPPVSIYFAINSARQLQILERQKNLESRIFNDLQQLSRSSDESNYLIREHTRICQNLRHDEKAYLENLNDPKLDQLLAGQINETIRQAGFPCEFEFLVYDQNYNFSRSIHFGHDIGLQAITRKEKKLIDPVTPLHPWQTFYRNILSEVLCNNITKISIRQPGQCMTLSGEKISNNFFMLALGDMSDFSIQRSLELKIKRFPARDYGIGTYFPDSATAFFTSYFSNLPVLKKTIQNLAGKIGPSDLKLAAEGHDIIFSRYDPLKRCRFFATAPGQTDQKKESETNNLWLAVISIISCTIFKLLAEKLMLGRGPDLSFKFMIPAVFIFLIIQPVFASAYLAGEFFRVSYANETTRVGSKLGSDLVEIDLASSDGAARSLNTARSFDSIEKIASFTGMEYTENDLDLGLGLMQKLLKENGGNLFSSFWLCKGEDHFTGIRWQPSGIFTKERVDNMVAQLFKRRFLEILALSSDKFRQSGAHQQTKLDQDLKSEYSRDFFLKIFGSDAFFRFRQNDGIRIDISANYRREQMLATPISFQNQPYAYAAWYIERTNANFLLPRDRLTLAANSPRIALHGDEHSVSSIKFSIKEIADRHPELARVADAAHVTRTRSASMVETEETTQINMALPAMYSNFTLAGSEIMRSFAVFRSFMGRRVSLLVAATIAFGSLLAFAGALYFVWPLRELTAATTEVFMGNFSIRIHEDHPDEFAALGRSFNNMAEGLEEGMLLKSFVTDSVRREVAEAKDSSLAEKAETTVSSIVFAALCGFSEYQKNHGAQEVFSRLQLLLQAADQATREFGGEIDKMIEDKVMIIFEHRGHNIAAIPEKAIRTAAFISEQVFKETGMVVAAGVNTGITVAGIMGAEKARLSRTVVGDPVNLAARLAYEALKIDGGIVISGQLVSAVPEGFLAEKLPINKVKGKTQTIEAFRVLRQEKKNA